MEVPSFCVISVEGLPEDELALAVPQPVVDGDLLHIGGRHHVLVLAVYPPDAGDVGRDGYMVVRDPLGDPRSADFLLADTHYLELPDLVLVGHGQAFAAVPVAILFRQGAHQSDGIPGVITALKGHAFQFFNGEPPGRVHEGVGAPEGGLSHGQLLLVEAGIGGVEISIGMRHLGDFTHKFHAGGVSPEFCVHRAPQDGMHRSGFMICGRFHLHPGAVTAVTGV